MAKINKIPNFEAMGKQLITDIRIIAEKKGVDFFKDSFENEGFTNVGFEKWQQRRETIDYKILQRTAFLKDSIQVFNSNNQRIVFGSDAEYAKIHNEGGKVVIPITDKSRKYFWFMYKTTSLERWKWMALSKKENISFIMPKRQFIGESKTLLDLLYKEFIELIEKQFKQYNNNF